MMGLFLLAGAFILWRLRSELRKAPAPFADTVAEFKKEFGYVNFRELTGLDVKTKEGFAEYYAKVHDYSCADRIRFAVEKGIEAGIFTKNSWRKRER
jgi:hypothetical protein